MEECFACFCAILLVEVPLSWDNERARWGAVSVLDARTYAFDLFHGEVGIHRDGDRLRSPIDDNRHGTGRAMYCLNNSLISKSDARNFGFMWYHPIIRSRAAQYHSERRWSTIRGGGDLIKQMLRHAGRQRSDKPLAFLIISNRPST
jgi:hypothetical protein